MPLHMIVKAMTFAAVVLFATSAGATIVTDWNDAALARGAGGQSLRNGPPMVARALAIAHTCMYDAWAAYDQYAVGTTDLRGNTTPTCRRAQRRQQSGSDQLCRVSLSGKPVCGQAAPAFPATGADAASAFGRT